MFADEERSPGLAVDFLNTAARPRGKTPDQAGTPASLLDWLEGRGLLGGRFPELKRSPPDARILHVEALRLRESIARAFEAFSRHGRVPAVAAFEIDRVLASGLVRRGLVVDAGHIGLVEHAERGSVPGLLAPIALDAARVLAQTSSERLRRCASPECRIWFVDTSKGGRRKWCSMAACGNRAKATTHRRRRGVPARRAG